MSEEFLSARKMTVESLLAQREVAKKALDSVKPEILSKEENEKL